MSYNKSEIPETMTEKERAREFLIQHRISGADFVYTTGFDNMVGLLEAYAAQQSKMPTKEMIEQYFNNHFDCYTDVTLDEYDTTEQAMTKDAVLKMFEWLRNQIEKR